MTHKYTYAAVVAAIVAAAPGCSRGQAAQTRKGDDAARPIKVETIKQEAVRRTVEVVGTLAAVDEVTISSEADGVVSKILHDLGDRVHAGDALIELDREKAEYNLAQQKAALARALAQYGAPDPEHLPAVDRTPDVQKSKAELVQAQQAYDRADQLHKRQLVPKQTLDDADAMLQAKKAGYELSLQNAKNLQANIAAADAAARLADRQLRDTYIRAPFDGEVEKRFVNLGQLVKGSGAPVPVMALVRVDPLKVTAEIPEKMVPWIQTGEAVELRVDAYPDKAFTGKLSRISPAVDTATRAFPFEALVPNAQAILKPGTFARVRINSSKIDQVLTVSYSALQYRYGVNRVFVINGGTAAAKEVKVGERFGDRIEVLSGVNSGEVVAAADVERLSDGAKVKTQNSNVRTEN